MTYLHGLRYHSWEPTFSWVETVHEAADKINSYHEDYPHRVEITERVIEASEDAANPPPEQVNMLIHQRVPVFGYHVTIFPDVPADLKHWREVMVRVGNHRPPPPDYLPGLMKSLDLLYPRIIDIDTLKSWYEDFETIHPFQDGNGRVGSVVVAAYSHAFHPEKGYLTPDQ